MGRVWAARRLSSPMPNLVAVKTAIESTEQNPDFEHLFIDEARIASRIAHPNACAILAQGTERGIAYLVMEWVQGGTLHEVLARSPANRIDFWIAAYIATKVCAGLHAAHELRDENDQPMNVVHRDVSPQNILISEAGTVKLSDFGVARANGQRHRATQSGEFKGKLSYTAPEQLTTRRFDRRADIFALGCVLYQATTGRRPFQGDDALETMYRLLETDCDRPSLLAEDYPTELERIVMTALSKDAASRFQTAKALELELNRFLDLNPRCVSEADVAALVDERLRDQLDLQRQNLEIAAEEIDRRDPSRQDPGVDKNTLLNSVSDAHRPQSGRDGWKKLPGARFYVGAATCMLLAGSAALLLRANQITRPQHRPTFVLEAMSSTTPGDATGPRETVAHPRTPLPLAEVTERVSATEFAPRSHTTGASLVGSSGLASAALTGPVAQTATTDVAARRPESAPPNRGRQVGQPIASATAVANVSRDRPYHRATKPKRKLDPENPF